MGEVEKRSLNDGRCFTRSSNFSRHSVFVRGLAVFISTGIDASVFDRVVGPTRTLAQWYRRETGAFSPLLPPHPRSYSNNLPPHESSCPRSCLVEACTHSPRAEFSV